jgi:curli biogenesis system outer membrane secretion channel CsgG
VRALRIGWQFVPAALAASLLAFLLAAGCASGPPRSGAAEAVAVWDLDDLSPGESGQTGVGELLSAQVIEAIQRRGGYTVVERQKLVQSLEELRLGSSALADEETRLRLGRIQGARLMVLGGFVAVGGRMRIDLRLVDVETSRVRKAVSKTTDSTGLPAWMEAAKQAAVDLFPAR